MRGELAVDELEGPPRLLSQLGHGAREPPFEAPDQPVVAAPLTAIQLTSLRGEPRKCDLGVAAAAGVRLKGAQRTALALAHARLEFLGPSARRAAETADRHAEVVERLRNLPVLETLGRRAGLGQQIQRDVACGLTGPSTQNVRGHPHPGLRSTARRNRNVFYPKSVTRTQPSRHDWRADAARRSRLRLVRPNSGGRGTQR